jgi:ribosomal protein S19
MSVALPVPEKWRENTSVLAKQEGAQTVYKLMKQTLRTYIRFLTLTPEFVRSFISIFSSVS